ncbi:type II secretion system protein GspC [Thioalkalivibrio sp.]|uniref:type II secretion system protein GspC n=1 Tax=Thioalkalivibrio sp. TaxID=2093813 RepID=UPI0035634872
MLAIAANPPSMLPRALTLLLIVAAGVMAAQLTWQVLAPDVRPPVTADISTAEVAPSEPVSQESPLARVAEMPLFGELGERATPEPVVAPETRLRLRLLGLFAGDAPEQGKAIIAERDSPEQLYGIGDTIAGGQARLHRIHPDRVILERDGAYETLWLPRADGTTNGTGDAAPPARATPAANTSGDADEPRIQRSEWLEDPERLLQAVRARPVMQNGALHGLEVRPTRNARQFQQAGLRPGDVITSVNGMPLSSIEDTDQLLADLAGQSQVSIVVEREGQALPLSIQLID